MKLLFITVFFQIYTNVQAEKNSWSSISKVHSVSANIDITKLIKELKRGIDYHIKNSLTDCGNDNSSRSILEQINSMLLTEIETRLSREVVKLTTSMDAQFQTQSDKISLQNGEISLQKGEISVLVNENKKLNSMNENLGSNIEELKLQMTNLTQRLNAMMYEGGCPLGWKHFKNSCYYLSVENLAWNDAVEFCRSNGGDLVKVENEEKKNFLKKIAKCGCGAHYWLGATDTKKEGTYIWSVDSSAEGYFDWSPGQPNNYLGKDDCIELSSTLKWKWNDADCTVLHEFICEKKLKG